MTNSTELKTKVCVVGAGSWGTAVAHVFADAGCETTIWGRDEAVAQSINKDAENSKYLKGLKLSPTLRATTDLAAALGTAELVVCSIPTQQIRNVFSLHASLIDGKPILNTSKGIEMKTHARISEIFRGLAPGSGYAVLSGPSFAEEVVRRLPTAVTVASDDKELAALVQRLMSTPYFRAYTSNDVVGVEFAGSLKNVIAIASGIVNGLKLGYNAQAAVINRGIVEIARVSRKKGAQPMTFLGLAGMGDLVLTCTGPLSRNRRVGVLLGEGKALDVIQKELGGVAEGVYTAQSAYELAQSLGTEMPILNEIHRILYGGSTPKGAVSALMGRGLKEEWDADVLL